MEQASIDRSIKLRDGTPLPFLPKTHDMYIDQTTIIYGRRKSGKSVLVEDIMYICRDHISFPFVISQSSVSNTSFVGKVPRNCILTQIDKTWIENFLTRQKNRVRIFNIANDIKVLKGLFNKTAKKANKESLEQMLEVNHAKFNTLLENSNMNFAQKKQERIKLDKMRTKALTQLYKKTIRENISYLESLKNLSNSEKCAIKFLDFRPHVMLIFDDCASVFKKWTKEMPAIKEIFYNGRWYNISLIITAQDDKEIDSELRKNSTVSIFTTNQSATANFTRTSNAYPKHEQKRAEVCIRQVFQNYPGEENHKKLVYLQGETDDPFYYTIADINDDFRLGCPAVWELDNRMSNNQSSDNNTNDFLARYI